VNSRLSSVAEDYGSLQSVTDEESVSGGIESIRFSFEGGDLTLTVQAADDTIIWDLGRASTTTERGKSSPSWSDALLQCRVRWIWELRNHRGYADGIQLEFWRDNETTIVQLVAEGSALRPHVLTALET
jgi:hypothetical protein